MGLIMRPIHLWYVLAHRTPDGHAEFLAHSNRFVFNRAIATDLSKALRFTNRAAAQRFMEVYPCEGWRICTLDTYKVCPEHYNCKDCGWHGSCPKHTW